MCSMTSRDQRPPTKKNCNDTHHDHFRSLIIAKFDTKIPAGLPRRLHDVDNEKAAIRGIYNACCSIGCSVWRSSFQSPLSFDICDVPRVKCSKASERVEELDLRGQIPCCPSPLSIMNPCYICPSFSMCITVAL